MHTWEHVADSEFWIMVPYPTSNAHEHCLLVLSAWQAARARKERTRQEKAAVEEAAKQEVSHAAT